MEAALLCVESHWSAAVLEPEVRAKLIFRSLGLPKNIAAHRETFVNVK